MKVIDLFAGAGGFSQGFKQAGLEVIAAFDNEPSAMALHARNLPNPKRSMLRGVGATAAARRRSRHRLSDLTDLLAVAPDVADLAPDVVIGGPPCQAFSASGKRGGDEDPRARLTEAYAIVVCSSRPRYFVMENVRGAQSSKVYARALRMFRRAGYGVSEQVLDLSFYGVGQKRERLIVLGCLGEADGWADAYLKGAKSERPTTVRDVLGGTVGDAYFRIGHRGEGDNGRVSFRSVDEPAVATTTTADRRRSGPDGYQVRPADIRFLERENLFFMYPGGSTSAGTRSVDQPLPTITRRAWDAPGPTYKIRSGDVLDVHSLPCLSFEQLAALSGFPADWVWQPEGAKPLSKAARMLALANAVPPPAAERIARILMAHNKGEAPAAVLPAKLAPGFARWLVQHAQIQKQNLRHRLNEARTALHILNGRVITDVDEAERLLKRQAEFLALGKSRRSNLVTSLRLYHGYLKSLRIGDMDFREREEETTPFPASFNRLLGRAQAPFAVAAE